MKFFFSCVFAGIKATLTAVAALLALGIPVYLTLDVSLWFGIIIALEMFFILGVFVKASNR